MGRIERKSLDDPDEVRQLPMLLMHFVRVGALNVGRGIVQPGWRWSTHMRKETDEPLCRSTISSSSCRAGSRSSWRMASYAEMKPNDIFDVPPGHDAWVLGDEPAVIIDFLGNIEQLGRPASKDRIVTTLLMTDIVDFDRDRESPRRWNLEAEARRAQPPRACPTRTLSRQGGEHDG